MTRLLLERHQVWLYVVAIALGLWAGTEAPNASGAVETALLPVLALLLFVTFLQVPLLHVRDALRDLRFAFAVLAGNFVLLPLLAWGLVELFDFHGPVRLGILLVLLVPCTDWFITFCQLGRGDVPRAIAVTPLNLVLQLVLLPLYLWVMSDSQSIPGWEWGKLAPALLVVLVPLVAAAWAERWVEAAPGREGVREALAWWPVPLLSVVVFLIAGAQVGAVVAAIHDLLGVLSVFVAFLMLAAFLAKALAQALGLPESQGRTLAFSLGTRNSFVVLPMALALPAGWEVAAVVVVVQSLVELVGMVVYVWWIPKHLFKSD